MTEENQIFNNLIENDESFLSSHQEISKEKFREISVCKAEEFLKFLTERKRVFDTLLSIADTNSKLSLFSDENQDRQFIIEQRKQIICSLFTSVLNRRIRENYLLLRMGEERV